MVLNKSYGIQGQFKFDIYNKNNELKYTSDYINNFITSTGLEYIKYVGFADCFRYLSLGSGTTVNSITSNGGIGTTGLSIPVPQFSYIGGNTSDFGCPEGDYENYLSKSCGYRFNSTGVSLNRAWRIPTNNEKFFTENYTFKEYMITPGTTGVYGWLYDNNIGDYVRGTGCDCYTPAYDSNDGSNNIIGYGKEAPDFVEAYPFICSFNKAFTRIIKDITVEVDEYLVVNYSLTVNLQNSTGIREFIVSCNRTNSSDVTYNWVTISGYSSLVQPGIKLINNGTVQTVYPVEQMSQSYRFRGGESFIPPLGHALEPSCPTYNRAAYISTDNLQFKVNDLSGGAIDTGAFKPWNPAGREFPSGVMAYHKDYIKEVSSTTDTLGDFVTNLGWSYRPRTRKEDFLWPSQVDFQVADIYSNLTDSIENSETQTNQFISYYENPRAASLSVVNQSSALSARNRSQTTTFQFYPINGSLYNPGTPVRALVYAYKLQAEDDETYLPTLDSVIAPYNATVTGTINTGAYTIGNPVGFIETDNGVGHYWTQNENILFLQLKLNWSTPCPNDVAGC